MPRILSDVTDSRQSNMAAVIITFGLDATIVILTSGYIQQYQVTTDGSRIRWNLVSILCTRRDKPVSNYRCPGSITVKL